MRRKRLWWIAVGTAIIAVAVVIAPTEPSDPPEMMWSFLAGQKPDYALLQESGWAAVEGPYRVTDPAYLPALRKGPAVRRRMLDYKFRADYATVVAEARREALARGGVEDSQLWAYGKEESVHFHSGDDWQIFIRRSNREPTTGLTDPSAPFVTVKAQVSRRENFLGVVKRWARSLVFW